MKIAYLGPPGTFAERATKEIYLLEELIALQPIRRVVEAVEKERVELGVVPLENFYNGEVRETLDSLKECLKTRIIRDTAINIVHCLGALKTHSKIETILSKDQAIEQCSRYLCQNYPDATTIATVSTSEAAERIVRDNLNNAAAIGPEDTLKDLGLEILAKNICPNNKTRFVVIGRNQTEPTGNDKTFLVFHPLSKDRPGTLYTDLGFFAVFGINLDYIQSRPDGKGRYFFYVELSGHEEDEPVKRALDNLRYSIDPKNQHPEIVKVLGSYPNTDWKKGVVKC